MRSKSSTEELLADHTSGLSDNVYEDNLNNSEEDDSNYEVSDESEEPIRHPLIDEITTIEA